MKVYFIGAGPGDWKLLTLKAREVLESADIVVYAGSLVSRDVLRFASKKALIYDSSGMSRDELFDVMRKAKASKGSLARIHSGDPSIYSAIQEQIEWCEKEGIDYEVISGVSSFSAGAATLKQELTLPGVSQTVIITRVAGRTDVPKKEDLKRLAKIRATLIIFLSVDKIREIVKKLLAGYDRHTAVAVVSKASWPDEKIIRGTLEDVADKVEKAEIEKQALIYVGDVLKRKGFGKSRLYDKSFSHSYRK